MAVTLSIGVGIKGTSYNENYEQARAAIDLALGRGALREVDDFLDLRGEHIASLHLHHVVGAADDGVDTRVMATVFAGAGTGNDT